MNTQLPTTVLLADDHRILVESMAAVLANEKSIEIVGKALSGKEALHAATKLQPHVMLLDIRFDDVTGLEVLRQLKRGHKKSNKRTDRPPIQVIMLTSSNDATSVHEAMRQGASGYLLKTDGKNDIVSAIHRVAQGKQAFSPDITTMLTQVFATGGHNPFAKSLTEREQEIARFTARGLTMQEIGAKLFISPRTVETHRKNIRTKLHLRSTAEIIQYATSQGW